MAPNTKAEPEVSSRRPSSPTTRPTTSTNTAEPRTPTQTLAQERMELSADDLLIVDSIVAQRMAQEEGLGSQAMSRISQLQKQWLQDREPEPKKTSVSK